MINLPTFTSLKTIEIQREKNINIQRRALPRRTDTGLEVSQDHVVPSQSTTMRSQHSGGRFFSSLKH